MTVTVITACYGEAHVPFARVLLESLRRVGGCEVVLVVDREALALIPTGEAPREPIVFTAPGGGRVAKVAGKLRAWSLGLAAAVTDGAHVAFLDSDTLVTRSLEPAFVAPFGVAHTLRHRRWPINSGVVFARVNEDVRRWMCAWRLFAEALLDADQRNPSVDLWGAVDQAALVASLAMYELHAEGLGFPVVPLPAIEWNQDWPDADNPAPAIWHLKGLLPVLLGQETLPEGDPRQPGVEAWQAIWRSLA